MKRMMPDEEKESVLNESEFQEESLSPPVRETKSKQDRGKLK